MLNIEGKFIKKYKKYFGLNLIEDLTHHNLSKCKIDIVSLKILQIFFALIFNDFQFANILEQEIRD